MDVAKPTGEYAEQMLDPGGWPEVDEDAFYDRAQEYTGVLRQVTEVLETCLHQQAEVFDGGVWSGSAAAAAKGELGTNVGELVTLQNGLASVITWQRYIAGSIVQAKSDIGDNVEVAHKQINAIENDSSLDAEERATAINNVVTATYGANVSVVDGTAEQILARKAWKPPGNALKDLLDQKTPPLGIPDAPPRGAIPDTPSPGQPATPLPGPVQPTPATPPPVMPARPPQSSPGGPAPGIVAPPIPGTPPVPGQPPVSPTPAPGGPGPTVPGAPDAGAPGRPGAPGLPGGGPAAPLSPAAAAQPQGASGRGKGVAPASASAPAASPSSGARAEDSSQSAASAAATGMPAAPMVAGGSGGASARSGAAPGAPVGQNPSSTPPPTRPAAVGRRPARNGPAARTTSADHTESVDAVVMPPPPPIIPVSAARAARDAATESATGDAARRQSGGTDPLQVARRIAAALNAPGGGGEGDMGFFWVTAVTTGGTIVVANSYGLAYIPDGVQLPEQVHMASSDETIPATERARWATYPVPAVQGWADHHNTTLRAVIATEEQFANSDPGVAKVVLEADDIPESGEMVGRSRLQVVDPAAADRLAATTDVRLVDLLPPAPASENPPEDRRPMLWFGLMKPMSSKATGRAVAHLRAFHAYAAHAQEIGLNEAHAAVDLAAQRSAVADWLYWKHLTGLLDAALAPAS